MFDELADVVFGDLVAMMHCFSTEEKGGTQMTWRNVCTFRFTTHSSRPLAKFEIDSVLRDRILPVSSDSKFVSSGNVLGLFARHQQARLCTLHIHFKSLYICQ